jgi:hypothetical protein
MSRAKDLARLQEIAALMRDHRLNQLHAVAEKRRQSQEQIAALDDEGTGDLPMVAGTLVAQRYQVWADRRRTELNIVLARQTAEWIEARDAACKAFGQAEALRGLQLRLERKR